MPKTNGLTEKQQRFVEEYLVDLNATQAAIRAGYSAKNAGKIGPELLGKTRVAAAIQAGREKQAERTKITADRVLKELAKLAFSNMDNYIQVQPDGTAYVDLSTMTSDQAAAIREITTEQVDIEADLTGKASIRPVRPVRKVKLKLADKKSALELLGKHLGIFDDRLRHLGPDGGAVQMRVAGLSDAELAALDAEPLDDDDDDEGDAD